MMGKNEEAKITICTAPPGLYAVIKNMERPSDSDILHTMHVVPHEKVLQCFTLGLSEETGEVVREITKKWRYFDHTEPEQFTETEKDHLCEELGDILWYISQICELIGRDASELPDYNLAKLEYRRQLKTLKQDILDAFPDCDHECLEEYIEQLKKVRRLKPDQGVKLTLCPYLVTPSPYIHVSPSDVKRILPLLCRTLMDSEIFISMQYLNHFLNKEG